MLCVKQQLGLVLMTLSLLTVMAMPRAEAQVVNASPSATSANSQVTLRATVPSVVVVRVNGATSTLATSISPSVVGSTVNTASRDFSILGSVLVNSPSANVQCQLSDLEVELTMDGQGGRGRGRGRGHGEDGDDHDKGKGNEDDDADGILVRLSGSIGSQPISTRNFAPRFSNRQAGIEIYGDLDESTVTTTTAPGTYSGTLVITATLI